MSSRERSKSLLGNYFMALLPIGPGMRSDKRPAAPQRPPFGEALRFWFKLGWISFGGTASHLAIMHDELVEKKRWISNGRFLHALSHCMLLPGPEAQQLAIYIGWKLHGKRRRHCCRNTLRPALHVCSAGSEHSLCQIRQPAV